MNFDEKKPRRSMYIYASIAILVILVLNFLVIPLLYSGSIQKTDYTTFLESVDKGIVTRAEVQETYIYYETEQNGRTSVCRRRRARSPSTWRWSFSTERTAPMSASSTSIPTWSVSAIMAGRCWKSPSPPQLPRPRRTGHF